MVAGEVWKLNAEPNHLCSECSIGVVAIQPSKCRVEPGTLDQADHGMQGKHLGCENGCCRCRAHT